MSVEGWGMNVEVRCGDECGGVGMSVEVWCGDECGGVGDGIIDILNSNPNPSKATDASYYEYYKAGDRGVITRLTVGDPVCARGRYHRARAVTPRCVVL